MKPLVSIVTVSFNSEETIQETVSSINMQTYENIEHIVIDGASIDSTVEKVHAISQRNTILVSEADNGIYNAMNKGLALCKGDFIFILNSDDIFSTSKVVEDVVAKFLLDPSIDCIYGNVNFVSDKRFGPSRNWRSGTFHPLKLHYGWAPPHPATVVRRSVYEKIGNFDENLKIASDYDFLVRLFKRSDLSKKFVDKYFVTMRAGGVSNSGIKNFFLKMREDLLVMRRQKLFWVVAFPGKRISKFRQFVKF